jgi:hypothetical protein
MTFPEFTESVGVSFVVFLVVVFVISAVGPFLLMDAFALF